MFFRVVPMALTYNTYPLSRIISVKEIVSADYVLGIHPAINNHQHAEAWEFIYCLHGSVIAQRGTEVFTVEESEIVLIPPNTPHDIAVGDKNAQVFIISFTVSNDDFLYLMKNQVISVSETQHQIISLMIRELEDAFIQSDNYLHLVNFHPRKDSPIGAEQIISCCLEQVLILLFRNAIETASRPIEATHFRSAINSLLCDQVNAYMEQHISERLTVDSIAKHFHYSRTRLSHIYKNTTGTGIHQTLFSLRLFRAKQMLLKKDLSVTEISEQLGFSSPQYFSARFSAETGIPPSQYAEVYDSLASLPGLTAQEITKDNSSVSSS